MSYVTVTASFSTFGEKAKLLLSTAWLFRLAVHRVLSYAKSMPVLPVSKIGWKNAFRKVAYEVIPNRRYADSAVILVMDIYESCRQLDINFKDVELDNWLLFQQSEKEIPTEKYNLEECGRGMGNSV